MTLLDATHIPDWLLDLSESCELECKKAAGRDGKGEIPHDLWPTVSAFANTRGGVILLGIEEKPIGQFRVTGIGQPERMVTDLFNNFNNPQKVSCTLVDNDDIQIVNLAGKQIVRINIRPATRHEKPVSVGPNPLGHTYRRLQEGDRKCPDEDVRRMLAEQVEDERDNKILPGFGIDDIDKRSLSIYRQMLRDAKPGHPFLEEDELGLLKKLKGWRRDRKTGEEGLTLAGVLMFGSWDAIQDAAPHYFVDYREYYDTSDEERWVDRVCPDGTWSGNLFDFYRTVYSKLTNPESLKVPFRLKQGQRHDDTPVHEAIREALVNTIVHADYTGTVSVLVGRHPDMIGFRNPGHMRIPRDQAVVGGDSDCRNRAMHQMFLMIGLGERAGSGLPKIFSGWRSQHWRAPALFEEDEPPQTLLIMRMLELIPPGVMEQLFELFGDKFEHLTELERLILSVAATENVVTHKRVSEISVDHTHDITLRLRDLVKQGFLTITGHGRGAVYQLVGRELPTPDQVFGATGLAISSLDKTVSSLDNTTSSLDKADSSLDKADSSLDKADSSLDKAEGALDKTTSSLDTDDSQSDQQLDSQGRLLSGLLPAPVIYDLNEISAELCDRLRQLSREPREKQRISSEVMQGILLSLCTGHYMTRPCLAELVNRDAESLRSQYLAPMVTRGELQLAFPQNPTDPRQAYIAAPQPLAANDEELFDE